MLNWDIKINIIILFVTKFSDYTIFRVYNLTFTGWKLCSKDRDKKWYFFSISIFVKFTYCRVYNVDAMAINSMNLLSTVIFQLLKKTWNSKTCFKRRVGIIFGSTFLLIYACLSANYMTYENTPSVFLAPNCIQNKNKKTFLSILFDKFFIKKYIMKKSV